MDKGDGCQESMTRECPLRWRADAPHASRIFAKPEGSKPTTKHHGEHSEMSLPPTPSWPVGDAGMPEIDGDECFGDLVDKLCQSVHEMQCAIDAVP